MGLNTKKSIEKAILIGLVQRGQNLKETEEYLNELEFLTLTSGAKTYKRFIQRLDLPNPKTFVGKGKLNEIEQYIKEYCIDMAIFDDDLTPSQLRNIEKQLQCKILDRSNLILDIFASRAKKSKTSRAKFRKTLIWFLAGLAIVLLSIPWPFIFPNAGWA